MPVELNEFDKQLAAVIHQSRGMVGEGGETFAQMFQDMNLGETEANRKRLVDSLHKLLMEGYIQKVDLGAGSGPAQYVTRGKYELEKSSYYFGPKWGKKRLEE